MCLVCLPAWKWGHAKKKNPCTALVAQLSNISIHSGMHTKASQYLLLQWPFVSLLRIILASFLSCLACVSQDYLITRMPFLSARELNASMKMLTKSPDRVSAISRPGNCLPNYLNWAFQKYYLKYRQALELFLKEKLHFFLLLSQPLSSWKVGYCCSGKVVRGIF